jgi:hypothetical protein
MPAEIRDANAILLAGFPDGRNVFVSPTPELDMRKARRRDT